MKIEVDPSIFLTYKAKDVQTRLSDNPVCIDVKEDPLTASARLDKYSFDQAPVVEMGVVVGWILRTEIQDNKPLSDSYRILRQSDLISADAPLNDLLQRLLTQKLVFLVGASGIEGFVVQSDIERHVSRAHLYLLISGLEISMAKILSNNLADFNSVVQYMKPESKRWWELARAKDENANPIEYLDLQGLGKALTLDKDALIHMGLSPQQWQIYIGMLKNIRDWVAHSNTQEMRKEPFSVVVDHMRRTEEYIRKLISY